MSKNKAKKQAAARKAKAKRTLKATHRTPGRKIRRPALSPLSVPKSWTDKDYAYWLAHGANFLNSKYNEGLWEPLFPEIYEGASLGHQEIAQQVLQHFKVKGDVPEKMPVVSWVLQGRGSVWTFAHKAALENADTEDPKAEARKAHNGKAWEMFHELIKVPVLLR